MKTIKRGLCLLLAAWMLCVPLRAFDADFTDVPKKHWAYESVHRAAQCGLVQGVDAKRFGLGQKVTRAAYATMLCRLMGWELFANFERKKREGAGQQEAQGEPQVDEVPAEAPVLPFGEDVQSVYLQLKGRYILSPAKSGLMVIDQHRAHVRILFDRYA